MIATPADELDVIAVVNRGQAAIQRAQGPAGREATAAGFEAERALLALAKECVRLQKALLLREMEAGQ
jgi:hypothetical protein